MRILFFFRDSENLGIESLSSILKKNGHETDLLFNPSAQNFGLGFLERFNRFSNEIIDYKIKEFNPDLIAFSVYTNNFEWMSGIAKYIKNRFKIPIVMGGPHPTILPEYVIKKDFVDYIIIGEGEYSILKLVETLQKKEFEKLSEVPNLWYKNDGKICKNPLGPLISDLDSLPFGDKELFYKYGAFSERYYIMTSRGCPNHCTYCINHQLHKLYPNEPFIRYRSVENVIKELKWAKKNFNIKSIYFYDDNLLLNSKRVKELTSKYVEEKINLPFKCLTHPNSVSKDKIYQLKKAGCTEIDMGIESGSNTIRKNIFKREINQDKIIESSKIIKSFGILLCTLNIINNPKENLRDMLETVEINRIIQPNGFHITSLYPYPNTEISEICLNEKLLSEIDLIKTFEGNSNYRSKTLLNHPYKEYGERIRIYAPIFIHLPKKIQNLMFKLPSGSFFNIFYLFNSTTIPNALLKIRESIKMIFKTRKYYKNLIKSKKSD